MNNYRKAGFIIIGVIVVALYFLNNKQIELGGVQPITLHPISSGGGELQVIIKLKNPNLLSSTIKTIHEKFYINGTLLGILDNELNQGIPGLKETEFPTSIRFTNAGLQHALGADSANTAHLSVTIDGAIEFQNLFTSGTINIHQSAPVANSL